MKKIKIILKTILKPLFIIVVAVLLAIALRVFVFSAFKIPSPSMEPVLKSGDYIIATKLVPGARIFPSLTIPYTTSRPDFRRLKGIRAVKRNDVLVFNFPYTDWNKLGFDPDVYYVKRCVAIPGDTFYIRNGKYMVKGCNDILGNEQGQKELAHCTPDNTHPYIYNCFPYRPSFGWTIKNFGPLYVPRSGDKITMDTMNIYLYKRMIEYETSARINIKSDSVFMNDSLIQSYTFKTNYYFMAGDYVSDSRDSRYWGLLPEDHIVGKAVVIWKSTDPVSGKIRWDRILKSIR